ncbi:MAG: hypothetical protein NTV23_06920 [Propionibacteriales bacterium]|nr:hypothetical protein [Propionibacteriales bacterium]
MLRTRFMTAGLAAAAVASTITLASPATAAPGDARDCGLPAVPAVTRTVVVDPVFDTVPAVAHTEWLWARDRNVDELEFVRVLKEARTEIDWGREVTGPIEYLFTKIVVDVPAVPAVPPTPAVRHEETYEITPAVTQLLAEYRHQVTDDLRWESDDWGAQNGNGKGWVKTGNTKLEIIKPAVTGTRWVIDVPEIPGKPAVKAVTHEESLWAVENPGSPWSGPHDQRAGASSTEYTTTDGSQPAGNGWFAGKTRHYDAVTETGWAETIPAGTTPTGATRVARTESEETTATSALAPDGDGWTKVDGSEVTITDTEAQQVLVIPGSVTQVVVTPEVPASEPCVAPPSEDDGQEPAAEAPQAGPVVAAEVSPASVLPNTGGVAGWMIPAGLLTALAGAAVVRTSRRGTARP